jgi:hypothetical protein
MSINTDFRDALTKRLTSSESIYSILDNLIFDEDYGIIEEEIALFKENLTTPLKKGASKEVKREKKNHDKKVNNIINEVSRRLKHKGKRLVCIKKKPYTYSVLNLEPKTKTTTGVHLHTTSTEERVTAEVEIPTIDAYLDSGIKIYGLETIAEEVYKRLKENNGSEPCDVSDAIPF